MKIVHCAALCAAFVFLTFSLIVNASPEFGVSSNSYPIPGFDRSRTPESPTPYAFTAGNIVVCRVGNGDAPLGNVSTAAFLDEYTPGGTLVSTVALPTAATGVHNPLTVTGNSGAALYECQVTRTVDGRYVVLGGYAVAPGVSGPSGVSSTTIPRVIGILNAAGDVDTTTSTTAFNAGAIRSVASSDGTGFWAVGSNSGAVYTTIGSSGPATTVSTTQSTNKYIGIFDSQLYVSNVAGNAKLWKVGTGTPITTGQTMTGLPGFPIAGTPLAFFFADLDIAVPGVDTLYVADEGVMTGATGGGVKKFSNVAGSWVYNGTFPAAGAVTATNFFGLTGAVDGGNVILFATRDRSQLVKYVDATGYNAAPTAVPTLLATASPDTAFRGVALAPEEPTPPPLIRAMWVFGGSVIPNPVSTSAGRARLIYASSAADVDRLFVSVYQPTPNSNQRRMYEDADMAALNSAASAAGQEVWAAYGNADWPTFACSPDSFPVQRMAEVAAYNSVHTEAQRFDGVMLDVESSPDSEADFVALFDHYQCMRNSLPASVKLGAAISAFWNLPVTYPAGAGGVSKPAYQHIIDYMGLDSVVVMGYRDSAGTATCPASDGIICLDRDEIGYATSIGRTGLVLAGMETIDPSTVSGMLDKETFFEEGESSMTTESSIVATHFAASPGFGGFAIHNYSRAYLSGTPAWPAKTPTAAVASISGRVLGSSGRGIAGAVLTLAGGDLPAPRSVRSNAFGYFSFRSIPVGSAYIVSVRGKRSVFPQPTRMITLQEDVMDANFVAK